MFFHLAQMIRHKLEKLHLCTKKVNQQILEIIRNIELLCFIKIEKIKAYKKIIIEKLNQDNKYNKFINYLNKYLFKMDPNIYNYDKLINYKKEQHNNKYLEYLYTTFNVVESYKC
jgi:ribosome maturation protein Sdo1